MRSNGWHCINNDCGIVLGEIVGGEFEPASEVAGEHLRTRGPNLVVTCPNCGTVKVWYTADPITRALHQLIDAIVSVMVRRAVPEVVRDVQDRFGDNK